MRLPKVLIGGWPGSGTSFLANLIVEMGFSPGSPENLKPADEYNRWGYFEHLIIRELCWEIVNDLRKHGSPREYSAQGYFRAPVVPKEYPNIAKIANIAKMDNVEVYKNMVLPLIYWVFPADSKYIFIERPIKETFRCRVKRARWKDFKENYLRYQELMREMSEKVNTFVVQYHAFRQDFDAVAQSVADFLEVTPNIKRLRGIFRPRQWES